VRRRGLLAIAGAASLARPGAARAQAPGKIWQIGLLSNDAHTSRNAQAAWGVFREELQRLGWAENRTVAFELADSDGEFDRLPAVARELAGRRVDLIVVAGALASLAVRDATKTIPVVSVGGADPQGQGLVASLARPGGNLTGLSNMSNELIAKRLQLLLEIAPGATRVAYLTYASGAGRFDDEAARAAAALGLHWHVVSVTRQPDLAAAIAGHTGAEAWYVGDSILIFPREQVPSLLAAHRKPAIYPNNAFARAGGLLSYGANTFALWRRAASYVDRILRGARPADIPVEQPTHFELALNMATARAQGIAVPHSLLLRADEVIE
jgi:putative ABC transport system substrate-binding protein